MSAQGTTEKQLVPMAKSIVECAKQHQGTENFDAVVYAESAAIAAKLLRIIFTLVSGSNTVTKYNTKENIDFVLSGSKTASIQAYPATRDHLRGTMPKNGRVFVLAHRALSFETLQTHITQAFANGLDNIELIMEETQEQPDWLVELVNKTKTGE